eukprot:TRINITY_DN2845_c3_g1::TRINITY_DN2845_c3_g1_i6::g.5061::m.5061 TRINITY_DN2845_c3_g1::TRINITY_DN2845_c3_g1_i6::g.5061  ORF type:complete len:188 (-),score=28.23 TRINITY_DN2845_c3_g1_i6:6-569(-)
MLTCLLHILNWLCIQDALFTKAILTSITSESSLAIKSQDRFAWTFLQSWCQVLHVLCDYPLLREQHGQSYLESDDDNVLTSLSKHLAIIDSPIDCTKPDIHAPDAPGFVPLKAAILQFVHHWQLYLHSANHPDHASPSFPVEEPIYVTFWCELGSVMDMLPIPFLHELSRDICAHLGQERVNCLRYQ